MLTKLRKVWKTKDLRKKILFVLGMLIIFRIAAHIPLPGINIVNLRKFFASSQMLGLLNILSGGGMTNFSVVALGIGPYITASIILQLLTMIIPKLEELSKEGEAGRQKINQYTRILTIPLAILQAYSMIILLNRSQHQIIDTLNFGQLVTMILVMTTGTIFLMWLGELITEKKIGHGISLIIFTGIISRLPSALQQTIAVFDPAKIVHLLIFAILAIITVGGIVVITEGQRNIPVSYAKRVRGNKIYGGMNTYLPLRVNQAGMIPIIFAISIILFPSMVAQFFMRAKSQWIVSTAEFIVRVFQNQAFYGVLYFILVVAFTYFYTAIVFHPYQIAENLQKQGGFIPGIRPGHSTAEYLANVSKRIMLTGALFLGLIAVLPLITQRIFGLTTMVIGGAGLLIVVSVVIETVRQIDAQLTMRNYEGI